MGDNTQRQQFILEVWAKGNRVGDPAAPVILNPPPPPKKNKGVGSASDHLWSIER